MSLRTTARLLALAALSAAGACSGPDPLPVSAPGPVFLLGFDGLAPDLLAAYEAQGLLPNFAALRREGAIGDLRSTIPMTSPPAWTTVATGVPPAAHGIWSFWIPTADNPRGRFVDATCRLAPAFWQDLSDIAVSVGIVNVPITTPPDEVNGFMIGGFPYPEGAPLTYPPELEAEITAAGYERDAWLGPPQAGAEEAWLDRMMAMEEARRRIGLGLLFDRRPDVSFIVFTVPDRIQHHLWKFHDPEHPRYRADAPERLKTAVRDVYVWCDEVLGEVRAKLPERATLFVVSDHGFGPAYTGVSKAAVLSRLGGGTEGAESRNLFGGDFHLASADSAKRAAFLEGLRTLRTDDGAPVAAVVHDVRGERAPGYGLPLGPDVVAEEADGLLFFPGTPDGPLVGPLPPTAFSGWHRRAGVFAACGPAIVPGEVRTTDLRDIAAMVTHLAGKPIPRRYVHNIPRQLFAGDFFLERPMVFQGDPTDGLQHPGGAGAAPDPAIAEQLKSVGYLR